MSINKNLLSNFTIEVAMDPSPLTVTPDISLAEAIYRLSQPKNNDVKVNLPRESNQGIDIKSRSSCLLVVENHQLLGILTERDIVRLIASKVQFEQIKISDVMTDKLITISDSEIEDIYTVINYFQQYKIRHLPVLSEAKELVGLITPTSIRNSLKSFDLLRHREIKEVMNTDVIHDSPNSSVLAIAEKMAKYGVSCIVIVCTDKQQILHPIGIVTERDIVQFQALGLNFNKLKASDIMSTPLSTLSPVDTLWQGHQQMQKLRVRRLVVCDRNGKLLGLITQTNILQNLDPLDMCGVIHTLRQEIQDLQTEKIELLHRNNSRLEEQVEYLQESVNKLEQRNYEMTTINQMMEFLQACAKIEDANEFLAEFLKKLFPGFSSSILLKDECNCKFESVSSYGNLADSETLVKFNDCWALRRGQTHIASNAQPGLFCHHVDRESQPTTTICIPLLNRGKVWGLFYLRTQCSEKISHHQKELAHTVAEQISLALYNLKLREKLRNDSIRDALTGLFNRRYLDEYLKQEIIRAKRNQQPLSVIMVDVDRFKRFNDTYGHDVGDIVLRELGRFLQQQVRVYDIACRYGGEEMTLILINTPISVAKQRAENICSGVRSLSLKNQGETLPSITISLGVACFPLHGTTGEEIVQRADRALYRAKKTGRNRVVLYQN
ncbi:MAG: diguanylate cyclase [Okeania sp. SIO2F4]|uniref:diguanylate cyclase n=1 Tax=Okeania sp. SIO2F4 TaxID=2607790 RepID=UPI00142A8CBC|nr:diguanylate cyclase [Okeania sp. SIO2F4]NES06045.1 diguanylate cyclase [Okeania sp. SIO2F4]